MCVCVCFVKWTKEKCVKNDFFNFQNFVIAPKNKNYEILPFHHAVTLNEFPNSNFGIHVNFAQGSSPRYCQWYHNSITWITWHCKATKTLIVMLKLYHKNNKHHLYKNLLIFKFDYYHSSHLWTIVIDDSTVHTQKLVLSHDIMIDDHTGYHSTPNCQNLIV